MLGAHFDSRIVHTWLLRVQQACDLMSLAGHLADDKHSKSVHFVTIKIINSPKSSSNNLHGTLKSLLNSLVVRRNTFETMVSVSVYEVQAPCERAGGLASRKASWNIRKSHKHRNHYCQLSKQALNRRYIRAKSSQPFRALYGPF